MGEGEQIRVGCRSYTRRRGAKGQDKKQHLLKRLGPGGRACNLLRSNHLDGQEGGKSELGRRWCLPINLRVDSSRAYLLPGLGPQTGHVAGGTVEKLCKAGA